VTWPCLCILSDGWPLEKHTLTQPLPILIHNSFSYCLFVCAERYVLSTLLFLLLSTLKHNTNITHEYMNSFLCISNFRSDYFPLLLPLTGVCILHHLHLTDHLFVVHALDLYLHEAWLAARMYPIPYMHRITRIAYTPPHNLAISANSHKFCAQSDVSTRKL
jgi:hypothetical protein